MIAPIDVAEQIEGRPKIDVDLLTEASVSGEVFSRRKSKVQFHAVEVREYARSIGDNPTAMDGPPLGLGWTYQNLKRSSFSEKSQRTESNIVVTTGSETDTTVDDHDESITIPIDEYETATNERRRRRIMKLLKLRENATFQLKKQRSRATQRQASTGNYYYKSKEKDDKLDPNELTDEQINQLSATWLKIQPVPGKTRRKILLEATDMSQNQIEDTVRELAKLRNQRRSTQAMAETGLDDFQAAVEFCVRRLRRIRLGMSKKREQELLWEKAEEYWKSIETPHFNRDSAPRSALKVCEVDDKTED
ncbi:unnamed protein product [Pseudo-nitzschia multistriata]|uniref:Uncharacterized protein n=1 Tax=Pseudo-nitzschia multistriata TaxID=183589 RepID=A0A448Z9G7_9STRA|nr:unnamed protein product [Pseudo-nitzschia multistriata]